MSCRQWLSSAARQCQSALAQQPQHPRALSTSAPVESFRRIVTDNKLKSQDKSEPSTRQPPYRRPFPNSNRPGPGRFSRSTNPNEALQGLVSDGMERGGPLSPEEQRQVMRQQGAQYHVKDFRANAVTENYVRQMPRRWRTGEVYAPRDMSPIEMAKWRVGKRPETDVVDLLGFNPLDNYKNFSIISEFVTPLGRIKHNVDTGLRPVNQRKMAKAIRRAIGMGLHPSVHKHPEILRFGRHGVATASIPTPSDPSQTRL